MPRTQLLPSKLRHLTLFKSPVLFYALAFGSGILMGLAPAPLNAFPLAWIAIAPLWILIFNEGQITAARSSPLVLALLWGIGYHGLALAWITGLHPLTWMGVPWLASVLITLFCWVFITLWGATVVVVWTWAMTRLNQGIGFRTAKAAFNSRSHSAPSTLSAWSRVLVGTALWCGLERLWSFGTLYWTSVSYTQSPGNLAILHLGQISGPLTVTAAIVAINGLLAEAWLHYRHTHSAAPAHTTYLISAIGLLVGLHLLGCGLLMHPLEQPNGSALRVGLVQGNVPTRIKLFETGVRRAIANYTNGYNTLAAQGVEAVLTPEGALPVLWNDRDDQNPFYQAVLEQGKVAWLGTFVEQKNQITQSLLTLTPEGKIYSRYNKIKLVPLGEYIPLNEILGRLIGRLSPIESSMTPGTAEQRFDTPFGRAIASICYESAFPELFRAQAADRGQFILTASNLDPYSEVLMAQHQAHDIMRAIETDRWVVRATNTGYSGFIDPHGRVLWRSQAHRYELHAETIYRRQTQTGYVRWGDWLTPLLLGLAAIGVLLNRLGRNRETAPIPHR